MYVLSSWLVPMQRAVQQELKAAGLMASEGNLDTRELEWAGEQSLQQPEQVLMHSVLNQSREGLSNVKPHAPKKLGMFGGDGT